MKGRKIILMALATAIAVFTFAVPASHASTNINSGSGQHWAWNDAIGWIDLYVTANITVSTSGFTGYASSSAGVISLDCHTTPNNNICTRGNGFYQILNDGAGNLSGWAWNDTYGWISFWCGNSGAGGSCSNSAYRVTINTAGSFQGWAWNDAIGWINFNCGNQSKCAAQGGYDWYVQTSWTSTSTTGTLDSTTFDTGVAAGAQLNSVVWQGLPLPANTSVAFQFAVSPISNGPWNFTGPGGTTSTADIWPGGNPGVPVPLSAYGQYANFRYFRYRVILTSDPAQTVTPRVDDVVVHWSP